MPSNFEEGWGAVINEAMAAGCCVVTSNGPGAAPWLIQQGHTGFMFESGNLAQLTDTLAGLLKKPEVCQEIGNCAWAAMRTEWTPNVAACRLIAHAEALLNRSDLPNFHTGPCSPGI